MSRYFSNGTEGFAWMANWCDRCERDHQAHIDHHEDGCKIFLRSLTLERDEIIPEWIEQDRYALGDNVHCVEFRPCGECGEGRGDGDDEPKPIPIHPDQGQLFDTTNLTPGVPRGVLIDEGLIEVRERVR